MNKLSRRAILTGAGASMALPFMPSFRADSGSGILSIRAARADGLAPKRFVVWANMLGTLPKYYTPKKYGVGNDWELSDILAPLAKYKEKMTVMTGINMVSLYRQHGRNGGHIAGNAHMLSGIKQYDTFPYGPNAPVATPTGPSIDQLIAEKVPSTAPFKSLLVGDGSYHAGYNFIGSDGHVPRTMYWPTETWDAMFKDFQSNAADRERQRLEKTAVLDAVLPAYKSLSTRVSTRDKAVADAHLEAMFELERRIKSSGACQPPAQPQGYHYDPATNSSSYYNPKGPYEDHVELLARVMACDLTRVGSFMIEGNRGSCTAIVPGYEDLTRMADAHGLTHAQVADDRGNELLAKFHAWRMTLLAKFCDIMSATEDVDGNSMLDNMCILHASEILTGTHDGIPGQEWGWSNDKSDENVKARPEGVPKGMPYFYIGGLGGKLKTNAHLNFTGVDTYATKLGKYSHNELFWTIARQFGLDANVLPSFGDPECCKNLISEIMV